MNNATDTLVDVKKVMEDIKREIREKELYDELPAFEQISVLNSQETHMLDTTGLRQMIQGARASAVVPSEYPLEGSGLKRLLKKISQKLTRCTIIPMSKKLTDNHTAILDCLECVCKTIEQQQAQIAEQNEKIEKIYAALDRGEDV